MPESRPPAGVRWVRSFGADRLEKPIGIAALPGGELAVTDAGRGVVEIFDARGDHLRTLAPAKGTWARPMHPAASRAGLWIPEYLADDVLRVDAAGAVGRAVRGGFDAPAGLAEGPDGTLYVADFYHHQIAVVTPAGEVSRWGSGRPGEPFTYPTDVAVGGGVVYVADAYAHQIQVRRLDGSLIRSFGTKGTGRGQLDVATGIDTDERGLVYVADFENHRVQVFDSDGRVVALFGRRGSGKGQLEHPTDVAVAGDLIHVVDFGNHRVLTFRWTSE